MTASTYTLTFNGSMTQRGFWFYVWRVRSCDNRELLYVGMTGDSSSPNAASPFKRMGQHLDPKSLANSLLKYLEGREVLASESTFELVAFGPVFPEAPNMEKHKKPWSKGSGVEKALRDALDKAGYEVMNNVNSRQPLDKELWGQVVKAFAVHFPKLNSVIQRD